MAPLYSTDSTSLPGQMISSLMSKPSVMPAPALVLPVKQRCQAENAAFSLDPFPTREPAWSSPLDCRFGFVLRCLGFCPDQFTILICISTTLVLSSWHLVTRQGGLVRPNGLLCCGLLLADLWHLTAWHRLLSRVL